MTAVDLLPCPFCGAQPEWVNEALADSHYYIRCPHCQFIMKQDRRDKVIGFWNNRAQTSIANELAPFKLGELFDSSITPLLQQALNKWGVDSQVEMIIEECLELALALQKLKRKRGNHEKKLLAVIDEIADVRIIIEQAINIFGCSDDKIKDRIGFKLRRLKRRLNDTHT